MQKEKQKQKHQKIINKLQNDNMVDELFLLHYQNDDSVFIFQHLNILQINLSFFVSHFSSMLCHKF